MCLGSRFSGLGQRCWNSRQRDALANDLQSLELNLSATQPRDAHKEIEVCRSKFESGARVDRVGVHPVAIDLHAEIGRFIWLGRFVGHGTWLIVLQENSMSNECNTWIPAWGPDLPITYARS